MTKPKVAKKPKKAPYVKPTLLTVKVNPSFGSSPDPEPAAALARDHPSPRPRTKK